MASLKIISPRERKREVEYNLFFQLIGDHPGNGYSFPCKNGSLDIDDENYKIWKKSYDYCVEHPDIYENHGIQEEVYYYTESAVAECSCGNTFYLDGDCQCGKCGQWYNGFGQALKDPEYWNDYDY